MTEARSPLPNLQPILLAIGFVLLVSMSAATVWLVDRATSDNDLLTHTLIVEDKLSNVLLNVRRAESGQRGYLFTGNRVYLEDFINVDAEAKAVLSELRMLTIDNPARTRELDVIAQTMTAKFDEMRRVIRLYDEQGAAVAREQVLAGAGRNLMNALRDQVEAAARDEARLLTLRATQSQNTNRLLLYVTLLGAALIMAIGAVSVFLVQRNAKARETARAELEATNANLERIVAYRTADLTEANEEIQRFAYIVSHDLRSPLVNVMGFTSELEALRKDIFEQVAKLQAEFTALNASHEEAQSTGDLEQLGKDFDEAIRFIKTSIANMDRLINAVLKLSREGRRQFNPETIDMDAVLGGIAQTVAHRAAEKGAEISIGDLPTVESDRLAVEQIFSNLVDNALKYGKTGQPLKVEIEGSIRGGQAIYSVRDTGRGIDPRDHQRVFELFRRSGPQDRPGEGIGLAHVRALVRRLGGTMRLESELGKGSTFTVSLPRRWSVESRSVA